MMKLQSACLCSVTFLLLCRATSGKPMRVKRERSSSMSGAVYSTNSKPSVPIGLAKPVTVFSSTVVAMLELLRGPTALARRAFQGPQGRMDAPDGWTFEEGGKALSRRFTFKDFGEAYAFLTRVAL